MDYSKQATKIWIPSTDMKHTSDPIIRSALDKDRQSLANLIHFEVYVHRHLDWRPPIDWIGKDPCLVLERDGELLSALICPPDPPEAAWIRLFVVSQEISLEESWSNLWTEASKQLGHQAHPPIAAIVLRPWLQPLLEGCGFDQTQEIVSLSWEPAKDNHIFQYPQVPIRPMKDSDLLAVHELDTNAFGFLWRISLETLKNAYQQACVASVVEIDHIIVGYQISTSGPIGGHLARLAVLPTYQGKGIGSALVHEVQTQFKHRNALKVTVNTQHDNFNSLYLYKKAGFKTTGEIYPVYQYNWMR